MNPHYRFKAVVVAGLGLAIALAGCARMYAYEATTVQVSPIGSEQVPPVKTWARGKGSFTVGEDGSVSGSVSIMGLTPTAAHIHLAPRGKNGPVAIGLTRSSNSVWVVPAGAKFTRDQYRAFLYGETYVNFHTEANKGGEIRAQLLPNPISP
jgi:hypothetical protein